MGADDELELLTKKLRALEQRAEDRKKGVTVAPTPAVHDSQSQCSLGNESNGMTATDGSRVSTAEAPQKKRGWPEPNMPECLRQLGEEGQSEACKALCEGKDRVGDDEENVVQMGEVDLNDITKAPVAEADLDVDVESIAAQQQHQVANGITPQPTPLPQTPQEWRASTQRVESVDGLDDPGMSDAEAIANSTPPTPLTGGPPTSLLPRESEAGDLADADVFAYAALLGMKPDTDPADRLLLWVAAEGLQAPLPRGWCWHTAPEGELYYIHRASLKTQWEHPLDDHYRQQFQHQKALLRAVLSELDILSQSGWSLPLPMTRIVLLAESFLEEATELWLHRSWGVDDQEYAGEPELLRVPGIPVKMLRDLGECSVTPARPGVVLLSSEENDSGGCMSQWLEVSKPNPHGLTIVFREHLLATSTSAIEMA